MKKVLVLVFLTFAATIYSQEMKIKWQDDSGREFGITAPSGNFSFSMLQGDNISYNFNGKVQKIGNVYISYDFNDRVQKVGNVYVSYDFNGRVQKVGNLYIRYDYNGRVTGTTGSVK